jgi:hypothetical protein
MSRKTKLIMGAVFGVLLVIAAIAPLTLMLLPNPLPMRVHDLASQPSGAYITTRGTVYRVFPRAEQLGAFPPDAPSVGATPTLSIKSDRLDVATNYNLYLFSGAGIAVERDSVASNLIQVRPTSPLAPGQYIAAIARDDLFGGTDYVYFSVGATTATPTP